VKRPFLTNHLIPHNEKTNVDAVFASNYITPVGEQINLFEKELANAI
jgi:hypothetical protein